MLKPLYHATLTYIVLGLGAGVFYREFTKLNGFSGQTQLSVVHTHLLVLGALVMMILIALEASLKLSEKPLFGRFFVVYNIGLAVTASMLVIKGVMQVLGNPAAQHAALAGIAGLGHMTIAAGFAMLLIVLKRQIWSLGS